MVIERQKFYICRHCGNIISYIEDAGVSVVCCGEEMAELTANTSDGAYEKHVPDVKVDGDKVTVQVGSTAHPMTPEHHISWIYIQTANGGQRKILDPAGEPAASFVLTDGDKLEIVYEYCNLHGLWKATV